MRARSHHDARLRPAPRPGLRRALTVLGLAAALGAGAAPAALARPVRPRARVTSVPAANRTLSSATLWQCESAPASAGCVNSALSAIDRARAGEGVRPMRLPVGFASLSVPTQLLDIANSERADRGLVRVLGLSRGLDQSALLAARAQQDPIPNPFYGDTFGSNWAGGIGSTLVVDFLWMYDDGPGSSNIDCRSASDSGCWGHRRNIVYGYQAPLVMGAAIAGSSMTEVFVGADQRTRPGQPDAPLTSRTRR